MSDDDFEFLDGIALSSGFGHMPSFADTAFNSSLPRCSILTQKTGEQKRLSNVPDTISKSATALNIRVADLTPQSANSTGFRPNKPAQHKTGKRQSILNMVIKPASTSRRPSCPTLPLHGIQNKFQTLSHAGMATPSARQPNVHPSFNAQSPDGDLHNQTFTLGRPIPKFQIEPPTPLVGAYDGSAGNGHREHEERWRFESRGSDGNDGQQCPPALPSRVKRNASNVERGDHFRVENRYRNSMEGSSTKSSWRGSYQDECDEDSRDPDYDLPKLNYDCEDLNQTEADALQNEASEEDRDDDYSYPQFLYTLESTEAQARNPLSVVEETDGANDSYDYLPCCRGSDRTSICRSSAQMSSSDNPCFDDRGIYDVLPIRDSALTEGTGSRMSGIEPGLDDSGCIYQNDVFCRSPVDIYDYPQLQNPNPFPDANGAEYANGFLPPLPEKKAHGHKEVEKVVEKRRIAPAPPPSVSQSDDDVHNYMNAGDVRMSSYSNTSSLDEGVYLPMACGKVSDTIYTPMHSPDGNVFKVVPSESNCNRSEEEAKSSQDVLEPSTPQQNQSSGK